MSFPRPAIFSRVVCLKCVLVRLRFLCIYYEAADELSVRVLRRGIATHPPNRTAMKRSLLLVVALLSILAATAAVSLADTIRSGLRIPAGEQFILGGGQKGGYFVTAENIGKADVTIYAREKDGKVTKIVDVPVGSTAKHQFKPGQACVLVNKTKEKASLKVTATGDTNLGMRYEVANDGEKAMDAKQSKKQRDAETEDSDQSQKEEPAI